MNPVNKRSDRTVEDFIRYSLSKTPKWNSSTCMKTYNRDRDSAAVLSKHSSYTNKDLLFPKQGENGYNGTRSFNVLLKGHPNDYDDYDYDEDDANPIYNVQVSNIGRHFPNQWKRTGLSPGNAPWPKVPIVTKIDLARKSKAVNILWKEPDRISPGGRRPTRFLDLMSNIRYKIYNYIPTEERVKLQLVCRRIRDDIRVRIGIAMYCNEETLWGVSFMRDLLVDTVIVGTYRQPRLRPRDLIIRWCDTLHLKFAGPISMPYMDGFVNRCRGVQKISVTGEVTERQPIPTDPDRKRDYTSWRKLDLIKRIPFPLHYCKLLEICPIGRCPHISVQCTLEVCHCINIVKLKIVIDQPQLIENTKTMYRAILKFMQDHPSLKEIWVDSQVTKFAKLSTTRKELLMPERDLRLMSASCQLRRLSILEDNVNFFTWGCFLSGQRYLKILQLMHCMLAPVIYSAIDANAFTLTEIAINLVLSINYQDRDIISEKDKYLDLAVFHHCRVLKKLYVRLSRSPKCPSGEWDNVVVNFASLPKSLEVLAFQSITFHPMDLIHVTRLKKLKSLGVIIALGKFEERITFSSEFFGRIFWMRSLEEVVFQGMDFTSKMRTSIMTQLKHYFTNIDPDTKYTIYIRQKMTPKACHWKMLGRKKKTMQFKFEDDILYEV